ncbi:phospholipid carrier-dependent glycosyltransferase [Lysinibacter sp. HNR]|uniref:dolichyl-phosphate-mannose--protein mannosyltransferase n=1 Tax=Lysinibacter sp. HNR TaxID=3031408 RepID=UPI002434C751|nr:phospholipid carrier-dependent glycosyltransferase [Lysinibacter sp. HNR]WGD36908.1 phospholipid carrier-dependent glycosyltransferase [Lysinibacter sp. HNR]
MTIPQSLPEHRAPQTSQISRRVPHTRRFARLQGTVARWLLSWRWLVRRWTTNPVKRRRLGWYAIWGVTLLAAIARLWNLGHPNFLVFDEIYYVRDAYSQLLFGYPTRWPEGLGELFGSAELARVLPDASYVVHPPLGKSLIGLGMLVLGADNGWGWRISTALIGVAAVFVLMMLARRLFRSTLIAVFAGFLMAIDGLAIVMSRISLLDNFLMFFGLLGAWLVVLDRERYLRRWQSWLRQHPTPGSRGEWGPVLWNRPWLIAAGVAFGLATGVKWSGLYFLAAFGLYVVIYDLVLRRRAGLSMWFSATVVRQGIPAFIAMVPVAFITYLTTWTGWILTSEGWNRGWAGQPGNAATGFFSWVPHWAQSLWNYHVTMFGWHSNLQQEHPYQAHPLTWPLALRPTSMYFESFEPGKDGCVGSTCSEAISSLPNPLLWWAGLAAIVYLVYRLLRYRDGISFFILVGAASGYLPWLLTWDRTAVFQFYTIAYAPFVYLALAYTLGCILGRFRPLRPHTGGNRLGPSSIETSLTVEPSPLAHQKTAGKNTAGRYWVIMILLVFTLVSIYFYPVWTGQRTSFFFWQMHIWIPRFPLPGGGSIGWN